VRVGLKKCRACRAQFTVRMNTIFEDSHVELHIWLQAMALMSSSKKGVSANQLHRTLGITLKTAWFLAHRIRMAMAPGGALPPMGGEGKVVEVDETYHGRTFFAVHRNRGRIDSLIINNIAHRSRPDIRARLGVTSESSFDNSRRIQTSGSGGAEARAESVARTARAARASA
jgi:hypothetical protein